jgi:hypothetical protein
LFFAETVTGSVFEVPEAGRSIRCGVETGETCFNFAATRALASIEGDEEEEATEKLCDFRYLICLRICDKLQSMPVEAILPSVIRQFLATGLTFCG